MPRPTTALVQYDIPGRRQGGVRVNSPSKNQSYRILWTDDDGRTRERTRVGLEAAEHKALEIARNLAADQTVTPAQNPTLGDLLIHYIDGPGRSRKWTSEKSARRPAQIARRIFTDDDLRTRALDLCLPEGQRELQRILDRAAQAGCKPGSSEYAKAGGLINTLFKVGARDGLLSLPDGNPTEHLRYGLHQFNSDPAPEMLTVNYVGPELRPPTDRVREFIDATEKLFGAREARYVEVLAFGGTRPGEANALTRNQLRTDRPGLRIDQQLLELTAREARESEGASQQFRPPKWGGFRNAFFPQELLDGLFELATREKSGPNGVLFPSRNGGLRWQGNWRRDVFTPVAMHVGWPSQVVFIRGREERHWVWPVYGFRHHYANYLLKDLGLPLVTVARFMGHRDVRVTERMYLKTELDDLNIANRMYDDHKTVLPA